MTTKELFNIILALRDEKSVYDKKNHVLYMPDVSIEPETWYGIQVFHLANRPDLEEQIKVDGITQYCLGCIPAPGACQNRDDEYGWSEWYPFDDSCNVEDDDDYSLLSELLCFAYQKFAYRGSSEIEIRED